MKKFTVVTDLHIGTLQEEKVTIPLGYENLILLGDLGDCKRCLKKNVVKIQDVINLLKDLNVPYVASNHEGEQNLPEIYTDDETYTLFTHGHLCKKNKDKYTKDCKTKWEGSGYLMHVLTGIANNLIHIVPFGKEDAQRAVALAKQYGCTTIVLGHYHCSYDQVIDGVRVIVLPQGVHEIEI